MVVDYGGCLFVGVVFVGIICSLTCCEYFYRIKHQDDPFVGK